MYLNIGQDTVITDKNILGIFDLDNTTVSKASRDYLAQAEKYFKTADLWKDMGSAINKKLEEYSEKTLCK